ncbi:DUF2190 family protein [Neorhizobium sp. JUb45]|uniref:DUF2190 family protein n=1 Tax=Neorhizobium sp. JUb45 TaxID=2485113 RepID=UPI001043710B|nr:DUF2190 family protein [Neorhizobium sp. JUb45]TCR07260.1 putative RecA/RadA family phage recombinase [Neorhizobium sp. JUb45]
MKNYIQPGNTVTVTAPYDVVSGGGVLVGTIFGVAATSAKAGETVEIKLNGVYELGKTSAQAWTFGALAYWDDTNKAVTTTASGNTLIGKTLAVAANPSATGIVRLSAS